MIHKSKDGKLNLIKNEIVCSVKDPAKRVKNSPESGRI